MGDLVLQLFVCAVGLGAVAGAVVSKVRGDGIVSKPVAIFVAVLMLFAVAMAARAEIAPMPASALPTLQVVHTSPTPVLYSTQSEGEVPIPRDGETICQTCAAGVVQSDKCYVCYLSFCGCTPAQ